MWQQKPWNSSIPVCGATLQMQNTMRLRGSNVIAKTMTRPIQCGAALKMQNSIRLRRSSVTAKPWNVRSGAQRNPQDAKHNGPEIKRDSKPMKRPFPVHPLRLKNLRCKTQWDYGEQVWQQKLGHETSIPVRRATLESAKHNPTTKTWEGPKLQDAKDCSIAS